MLKIATETNQPLSEVRKISKEDFETWMAYFALSNELEKQAYERAMSKYKRKAPSTGRNIDISDRLLAAKKAGSKEIDLTGL